MEEKRKKLLAIITRLHKENGSYEDFKLKYLGICVTKITSSLIPLLWGARMEFLNRADNDYTNNEKSILASLFMLKIIHELEKHDIYTELKAIIVNGEFSNINGQLYRTIRKDVADEIKKSWDEHYALCNIQCCRIERLVRTI